MVRLALLLVMLLAVPVAWAEDDDVLDAAPLGQGIPEQVQELEREWADDVGLQEPPDPTPDDADTDPDTAEPSVDPMKDDPPEPAKARPVDETPRPAPRSALRKPRGDASDKPAAKVPAGDVPPPTFPVRLDRHATDED